MSPSIFDVTKQMNSYYAKNRKQWRNWLTKSSANRKEIWLIYYKKDSRKLSISHEDAVKEAICFGWIDGIVKKLDEERTVRRFTPRKPESRWSALNIRRAKELIRLGKMTPAGLAAFIPEKTSKQQPNEFSTEISEIFRQNKAAWNNFQAFPPYYRRMTTGWVQSAKKPETQKSRLRQLIQFSEVNKKIDFMKTIK
jgi:uncharacterized protein YdeI (YjbR/CyaY-like superfamily)